MLQRAQRAQQASADAGTEQDLRWDPVDVSLLHTAAPAHLRCEPSAAESESLREHRLQIVGAAEQLRTEGASTQGCGLEPSEERVSPNCSRPVGMVQRRRARVFPRIAGSARGSYCVVSHRHQFIFVHILKNGGSHTKAWLSAALCGEGPAQGCDACVLTMQPCAQAFSAHPNYLRWSWLRDPYDRAVSIYAMAKQYAHGTMDGISLADWWKMGRSRWGRTRLDPSHGAPQADFASSADGCLALDYLGSLEDSGRELRGLAELLDAEPLRRHLLQDPFARPERGNAFGSGYRRSHGGPGLRELARGDAALQRTLLGEFGADFRLLGCDA